MLRDAPLAFAFGSGMLAAFNPCGFALLPAYLGWFLGLDTGRDDVGASNAPGWAAACWSGRTPPSVS